MTKLWKIFEKITEKKTPIRKSITELTAEERAEIEELTELGKASREIADLLNLDVNVIYNYRKALKERAASKPADTTKDILANKIQQREILKEDFELEKLKLDLEQKKQQMQMDQLKFKRDMEEWKKEFNSSDEEEEDDLGSKAFEKFLDMIGNNNNKGRSSGFSREEDAYNEKPFVITPAQNTKSPQNQKSGPVIEDSQVTTDPDSDQYVTMSDDEIRKIIDGLKETYGKKKFNLAKLSPDKLLFDKIADQYPTLSDQSIDRAIQIFRSEY